MYKGCGSYGSVFLVEQKEFKTLFALKSILRPQVDEHDLKKYILQEKATLENVEFPFIVRFIRTFKDEGHLYFLTEYIEGLELYNVLQRAAPLPTDAAQFYAASIILAIEYLHSKNIVYRDLKPENIMVDRTGYIKLVDMGMATCLNNSKGQRTKTLIGTAHFMAPEVVCGKGYDLTADLWSIGVCLFEFMCGTVPFGADVEDPFQIFEQIKTQPVDFPESFKDDDAKRLISQLLNKDPTQRLGGSFAALKGDAWFRDIDWDKLLVKKLRPPYGIPEADLISKDTIVEMELANIKVIKMIEDDEKDKPKHFKQQALDSDWDKEF